MKPIRVLHLVGSPTSSHHQELSMLYADGCIAALHQPAKYDFLIALVKPGGVWCFPKSLATKDIDAAPPMLGGAAIAQLVLAHIDLALPHMFCQAGMTTYRALLSVLAIPYLGNRPFQMALTADKAKAKAVVGAAGVRVPRGELLVKEDVPTLLPPVVVKPNNSDNSDGVTFVQDQAGYKAALELAFTFSDTVLVEQYVPLGREVRCGIVVQSGRLTHLPLEEYFVDTEMRPVRTRANKLKRDSDNNLVLAAKQVSEAWIVDAADPVVPAVWHAASLCHKALGCEQYSLFDFRIDPDGIPWFLEAGLYCSFSPKSVLATMMAASGTPLSVFFDHAVEQLLRPVDCDSEPLSTP